MHALLLPGQQMTGQVHIHKLLSATAAPAHHTWPAPGVFVRVGVVLPGVSGVIVLYRVDGLVRC